MSQSFGKETSLLCLQQAVCSSPTAGDPDEKTGTASWPQARCSFWIRDCTKNKSKWGQIGTFLSSASHRITTPSPAGPSLANPKCLLATHLDRQTVGPFHKHQASPKPTLSLSWDTNQNPRPFTMLGVEPRASCMISKSSLSTLPLSYTPNHQRALACYRHVHAKNKDGHTYFEVPELNSINFSNLY